jgi:hypothetical protein
MLERHLENAIKELDVLINLTQDDITLIKDAKHEALSQKSVEKKQAMVAFETTKSLLNHELLKLTQENPEGLEGALNEKEGALLELFKEKLLSLKNINRHYSKLLISVNEFYGTLLDRMFAFDSQGYQKTKPLPAAMLQVSA